jgi:hypothetical protein
MVYPHVSPPPVAAALASLLLLTLSVSAQDQQGTASLTDLKHDGEYPLYIINSWSAPAHDDLESLISALAALPGELGFGPGVTALDAWRDRYYGESLARYRELEGAGPLEGNEADSRYIDLAREAMELLSRGEWDEQLFLRLSPKLSGAMVLLRPDITPAYRYWDSFMSGGVNPVSADVFFSLAVVPGPGVLAENLRDRGYVGGFTAALQSPRMVGSFAPMFADAAAQRFAGGEGVGPLLLQDAALSYNRLMRSRFSEAVSRRDDSRWTAYIDDLIRIEAGLEKNLPANLSGQALYDRLFLANGQYSDEYWAILGLLENPFFISDADRSAQVELIFLELLQSLEERAGETSGFELLAAVNRGPAEPLVFSPLPVGRVRRYALAIYDSRAGYDPSAYWSQISRGLEPEDGDDSWDIQSGIYPLDRSAFPREFASLTGRNRELFLLIEAARLLEARAVSLSSSDPAIPYLIDLRRLMIFADICALLSDSAATLPLELRVWMNLAEVLLQRCLLPEPVNIPFAWDQMARQIGFEDPAGEVIGLIGGALISGDLDLDAPADARDSGAADGGRL